MTWEGRGVFEVSSADPDSTSPVWVDLTCRILDVLQIPTLGTGRQNDLEQAEPSRLSLVVDNTDDALTYGNTDSPYASWWGPGRKCRYYETIAGTLVPLFTGYIEVPAETLITSGVEQRVFISASDRLARLDSAEPFISTLGAHIIGSARNNSLVGFWSLTDAALPFGTAVGAAPMLVVPGGGAAPGLGEQRAAVVPGGGPSIPGDDVASALFVPALNAGSPVDVPLVTANFDPTYPSLSAGQILTAVVWIYRSSGYDWFDWPISLTTFDGSILLNRIVTPPSHWNLFSFGSLSASVDSNNWEATDRWTIVGLQFGFSPNVIRMWIDDAEYTGTLTGSGSSSGVVDISTSPAGGAAYLQLYIGAEGDFTRADFLTQREVGLQGLERQTTGQRMRSIAKYAGVPDADQALIDTGTTTMQRAALAGQSPLAAMRDAETTEQGLLYVDGSGVLAFKDRRTLYNI